MGYKKVTFEKSKDVKDKKKKTVRFEAYKKPKHKKKW